MVSVGANTGKGQNIIHTNYTQYRACMFTCITHRTKVKSRLQQPKKAKVSLSIFLH